MVNKQVAYSRPSRLAGTPGGIGFRCSVPDPSHPSGEDIIKNKIMYDIITQELVEPSTGRRFIGSRASCRFCGTCDPSAFGAKTNAHSFPQALGNRTLFSLDECKACNAHFSVFEDALCKAVGPFLTLGGVSGKKGVRQTGRTKGPSLLRHSSEDGKRHISGRAHAEFADALSADRQTGHLILRMPIEGDKFVPLYAYKALVKMGLALLPSEELNHFAELRKSLETQDAVPTPGPLHVGFSHAYVGNVPPVLAGALLRRQHPQASIPHMIFIFVAGSVCFQIWLRSDDLDDNVPEIGRLGVKWTSQLPRPEGGFLPIRYSDPLQWDWSGKTAILQPFEAFQMVFDPQTTAARFIPVPRTA